MLHKIFSQELQDVEDEILLLSSMGEQPEVDTIPQEAKLGLREYAWRT